MKCAHCNEELGEIVFCFGSNAPFQYLMLEEQEREERSEINNDLCTIDEDLFFIRGHLEIPIIDSNEIFIWSIWSSLSKESFIRINELWESESRMNEPSYFGWFSNELNLYPSTLNLKCEVQTRELGQCPLIILEPTKHPLAIEQRNGITMNRVQEINHLLMHRSE